MEEIKNRYNFKAEEVNLKGNVLKNLNLLKSVQNEAEINRGKLV